jgi:hypothetical protein
LADFRRGIKAGVATGGVYLVISAILAAIDPEFLDITDIYAAGLTPFVFGVYLFVLSLLVNHVLRGIIFGVVFAALYYFLPGSASIKKGVVLSSFLWILAVIQIIYTTPGWHANETILGGAYYYSGPLNLSSIGPVLAGIISALFFGALTGFLWGRFRGKELAEERKGRSVLLVSFILGGLIWVLPAIVFIIGVVFRGIPAIGPDFWWLDLLNTLVVFLGLPGWILARAAWRKTKSGESGFKWGVAGGVMMAVTGVMLLPGALAIIGGVFSGRKPATESNTAEIEQ